MICSKVFIVLCALSISVLGQKTDLFPPIEPTESTSKVPTKPTVPSTTSTTASSTTTQPTSSTTPAPKTTSTTSKPTTPTTSKPTTPTTSKPTTSTTSAPNITTTQNPTPSPSPKPIGPPDVITWSANYTGTNYTCMTVQIALQYQFRDLKTKKTVSVNVPKDATATGVCDSTEKDTESLKIMWADNNSMEFKFVKNENTSRFELEEILADLNSTLSNNGKMLHLEHQKEEFATPLKNSYKCARNQQLSLNSTQLTNTTALLQVSHLQFQVFQNHTGQHFDSALDCEESGTPDVVPIVVGCVLVALVLFVLVGYLVGRRRWQARGYLSM